MANLTNLTHFVAQDQTALTKDDEDVLVVCLAARFDLPAAGQPTQEPLQPSGEQVPPVVADVYWGEPGSSSLRYEGQTAYHRPGTDIYLSGHAWAPLGRPVQQMDLGLRVGPCRKIVRVIGDRRWRRGIVGLNASGPEPFTSMPLVYERSFGGSAEPKGDKPPKYEPRNPVGCGFYGSRNEALHQPLPNLEDPARLINDWSLRPAPVGCGPIARNWQPRLGYAGTYDETWMEERAPLWPFDFDERFFQAATPGLVASPWLQGGEPVVLQGCSPDGAFSFFLPQHRFYVKSVFRGHVDRRLMPLDAVLLEPDEGTISLTWRAAIPLRGQLAQHQYSLVRELEVWEDIDTVRNLLRLNDRNESF